MKLDNQSSEGEAKPRDWVKISTRCMLAIILVCGGLLRFAHNELAFIDGKVHSDARYYGAYAKNIVNHATYSMDLTNQPPVPDSFWAPGYPMLLALLFKLSDMLSLDTYTLVMNVQLAIGVLTIALTFLLAKTFLPRYWALLPATLVAISPHLVSIGQNVLTETAFGFFLLLSLWLFALGALSDRFYHLLGAGLTLAFTWLINPTSIFVAPILGFIYFSKNRKKNSKFKLQGLTLIIVPLIVVSSLWTLRTAISVPEGSPRSSDRLLSNLIIGMHSNYYETWRENKRNPSNPATLDAEVIGNSYPNFIRLWFNRFSSTPLATLQWYVVGKPIMLWSWNVQIGYQDIYIYRIARSIYDTSTAAKISYIIIRILHPFFLVLALFAPIFLFKSVYYQRCIPVSIYASTISVSLVYIASQADPRYSFPLRPELYLCATITLYSICRGICYVQVLKDPAR